MNKIVASIILLAICKISLGQLKEKHTIYFDLDEDTFAISEGEELNTFFEELLYKPILDVKILGYCDDRGSKEYNMALSTRRVESVSEWLQKNNITLDHISKTVEGKGEVALKDATDDNIDDVRAKNRRVDVVFYLQEQIADQLAIKKLNKKDLTDDERKVIDVYESKVVSQIIEKKDTLSISKLPVEDLIVVPSKLKLKIDESKDPFRSLLSRKLKKGQVIRLENILFFKGRSTVTEASQPLLERMSEILLAREDIKFEIRGHVCCINPTYKDAYNRDTRKSNLSHDRAEAIFEILKERGIAADRMTFKGYGRTIPLGGPDRLDRRVELYITEIDLK